MDLESQRDAGGINLYGFVVGDAVDLIDPDKKTQVVAQ